MLKLIPTPKKLEIFNDFISCTYVCLKSQISYERLEKATKKLPLNNSGISLFVEVEDLGKEEYEIDITKESIKISAKSEQGAFWAIQTLRQIFKNEKIPCLHIEDYPDFSYRGFYHDVTRGKVPTMDTLKKLVDEMAYYKMNSLQLYVEHTYEFKEFKDSIEKTGYMTAEETKALDDYCYENYIELLAELGKKYNACGMLNTNWGDWGNPCSLELAMYSFVWGGEKAWNSDTIPNDEYFDKVNFLLYDNKNGCRYIKELDELHSKIHWCEFAKIYSNLLYEKQFDVFIEPKEDLINTHKGLTEFIDRLSEEKWTKDEFRQEMLIAAEGLKIMAEIFAKHTGFSFENECDINKWILKYREKWISKNKEYELLEIEKMFKTLDKHYNK